MSQFLAEWQVLQNQYDSYEKFSLVIKLVAIILTAILPLIGASGFYLFCLLAVLWLQDGIWKTFQSRIEARLYLVEQQIAVDILPNEHQRNEQLPCQFNQQFLQQRKSGVALMVEYLRQALRPTVAFPYGVLFLFVIGWLII